MIKREIFFNMLILISLLTGLTLTIFEAPLEIVIVWGAFILGIVLLLSRSPIKSEVLFAIFLFMYIFSFAIQVVFFDRFGVWNYEDLRVTLIAGYVVMLGVFLASITPILQRSKSIIHVKINRLNRYFNDPSPMGWMVMILFAAIALIGMWLQIDANLSANAVAKHQFDSAGRAAVGVYVAIPILYLIAFRKNQAFSLNKWLVRSAIFIFPLVLYFFFVGERDVLVRALLMVVVLGVVSGFISKSTTIFIFFLGLLAEPLLQAAKAIFVLGFAQYGFSVRDIFFGEFSAQGRNFYLALQNSELVAQVYKNSIWNDFLRFLYLEESSSVSLFGREILGREGGAGLGFSLFAQIYFAGGYIGLFFLGFVLMQIIKFFEPDRYSTVSIFFYVSVIFGISYSFRADIANLLGNVIKVGIIPMATILISLYFLKSRKRSSGLALKIKKGDN